MPRLLARRLAVLGAASSGLVLLASPAFAHPSFNPNQLTAGEQHDVEFVVPHGCAAGDGMPTEGEEASPTIRLDLQIPDGVDGIGPTPVTGWTVTSEVEAITWTDDGGATAEPIILPLYVEIDPDLAEGTTLYWTVLQTCEEGSTLWVAHDDHSEESPAAVMLVGASTGSIEHDDDGGHAVMDPTDEHDVAEGTGSPAGAAETDDGYGLLVLFTLVMVIFGVVAILGMDESTPD